MSGAGYMFSCDLVHVVSSPMLKPVTMLNEDAYMGLVLLPFNITRITYVYVKLIKYECTMMLARLNLFMQLLESYLRVRLN